jgi:hypothetical protein
MTSDAAHRHPPDSQPLHIPASRRQTARQANRLWARAQNRPGRPMALHALRLRVLRSTRAARSSTQHRRRRTTTPLTLPRPIRRPRLHALRTTTCAAAHQTTARTHARHVRRTRNGRMGTRRRPIRARHARTALRPTTHARCAPCRHRRRTCAQTMGTACRAGRMDLACYMAV